VNDCQQGGISRRSLLKATGATLGAAAFAAAVAPLTEWTQDLSMEEFLQRHYLELGPEELQAVLRRIEEDSRREHGVDVHVSDHRPQEGVQFAYALNLSICIGCRKCAEACHHENNHDRAGNESYIRVFELDKGSIDFARGNASYDHPVPQDDKYYMPVQCQQCDHPPCVHV